MSFRESCLASPDEARSASDLFGVDELPIETGIRPAELNRANDRHRFGGLEAYIERLAAFAATLALALSSNSARTDTLIGSDWSGWIAAVKYN